MTRSRPPMFWGALVLAAGSVTLAVNLSVLHDQSPRIGSISATNSYMRLINPASALQIDDPREPGDSVASIPDTTAPGGIEILAADQSAASTTIDQTAGPATEVLGSEVTNAATPGTSSRATTSASRHDRSKSTTRNGSRGAAHGPSTDDPTSDPGQDSGKGSNDSSGTGSHHGPDTTADD